MIPLVLFFPLVAIPVVLLLKSRAVNMLALLSYSILFAITSVVLYIKPGHWTPYFGIDSLNILFLLVMAVVLLAVSVYNIGFLRQTEASPGKQAVYTVFFLLFTGAMAGAILSRHLALYWVFIEATTLFSAPLIYFDRSRASVEAAWKYVFICSIGIALAFVGIILLSLSTGETESLFFHDLYKNAGSLVPLWLKLSFPFILVGLGTKMGLAPVHAWMPDAYSEAPAPAAAMLSGALKNIALLGILQVFKIMELAHLDYYSRNLLLVMGFLSLLISAVFIMRTANYKRMLAYSSIENMGIIAIGVGIGGIGLYAALLHMVVHSLAKTSFFFIAGNIFYAWKSNEIAKIRGIVHYLKINGWLWIACFIALSGMPPFASFLSEFLLVKGFFLKGYYVQAGIFFFLLTLILYGMGRSVLHMSFGHGNTGEDPAIVPLAKPSAIGYWPVGILLLILLLLGIYMPGSIDTLIRQAAMEISPV